ncbi:MAG: co-chaperone GroES [Pseudomonadota bacterium]
MNTVTQLQPQDTQPSPDIERLLELSQMVNIADDLGAEHLGRISQECMLGYQIDLNSRAEWEKIAETAMKAAKQVKEEKNTPWPNASNVKYPLLTSAAIQFAARAYPAIVDGNDVAKARVIGEDPDNTKQDRADRISRHMSYQLLEEIEEWDGDTDTLVHVLPILGTVFRKVYYDPAEGRPVCELIMPTDLVVNNDCISFERAPRYSHRCHYYPHEIQENFSSRLWRSFEYGFGEKAGDSQSSHEFIEQHCRIDLDEDGYTEPYIVTIHKKTGEVARIVANYDQKSIFVRGETVEKISAQKYFVKYDFIPDPEGKVYSLGFGLLLHALGESVNTVINQLIDAGTLSNTGGGFIGNGVNMRGGALEFKPGEWKKIDASGPDLRQQLVPLPVQQPSAVLFSLLGLLIDAAQDITAVKDVLTGGNENANAPVGTTLALIEQGTKVFSAIYKRVRRSLRKELKLLYDINAEYLPPETYFDFHDDEQAIKQEDYAQGGMNVVPVSDPNAVTDMQKLGRSQYLGQFAGDPYLNQMEIRRRMLEAANIEDIDSLLVEPSQGPSPEQLQQLAEMDLKERKMDLDERKARLEGMERITKALKNIADAEAIEAGVQLDQYKSDLMGVRALLEEMHVREQRALNSMENQQGNPILSGPPQPNIGGLPRAI